MKKILYFIYAVVLVYIIFMIFMDYSSEVTNEMNINKIEITINKPERKNNKEFLSDLNNITEELNTDIMYSITDVSGKKTKKIYFITTHTSNFIHLYNLNIRNTLDKYDGITNTIAKENYFNMKYSTLFYEIFIYNINEAERYNLESCNYYINANLKEKFIKALTDEGYEVFTANSTVVKNSYLNFRTLILPLMILLMSILFYSINKRKEDIIKLLEGYSKVLVIIEDSFKCYIIMLFISSIFVCLSAFITTYFFNANLMEFIIFLLKRISLLFLFLIISVFIIHTLTIVSLKTYHMKGKNDNYDFYFVTFILKIVFSFLIIISFSYVLLEIRNINYLNKTNKIISNELKYYVTLPINSGTTSINDTNQLDFNSRLDEFYDKTVDKYNGILINTRNYRVGNLENDDSLAKEYGQTSITVNENYLNLNVINDINGEPISEDNINFDMFNLLIPNELRVNERDIIDKYSYSYDIDRSDINCIYYKQNEEIRTFNPYSGRENEGLVMNPIIEIYDRKYLKNQMLNYVSGQYYLLNINSQDPYSEILPVLKECGLDGIILYTTNISNVYDNSISNIKERLNNDLLNALLYTVSIILLILYNCNIYFQIYGKKIVYKRLCGFSFIEIHMIPLILLAIQYMILILLSTTISIEKSVILCALIFEIYTFVNYTYKLQKKYILDVIKGGE